VWRDRVPLIRDAVRVHVARDGFTAATNRTLSGCFVEPLDADCNELFACGRAVEALRWWDAFRGSGTGAVGTFATGTGLVSGADGVPPTPDARSTKECHP